MDVRNVDDQDELINPNRPRLRYIDQHIRPNCLQLSKRLTIAILIHIGFVIIFAMRSNVCFFNEPLLEKLYPNDTYIDKMYEIQKDMNLWFTSGYVLVQIPAAILSYKYPSQRVFGICILASSIIAIIESFSLNWVSFEFGYAAFFQALTQSASIPAVHGILFVWAPPSERATLASIAYSGTFMGVLFGVVFSNLVCGFFEEEHLLALYGTAGIVWYLAWIWLVFERPEDHPTIADSEFEYLKRHTQVPKTKPPIRWGKIFSSLPCWALFVVYLCRSYNTYYLFQADYSQFMFFFFDVRRAIPQNIYLNQKGLSHYKKILGAMLLGVHVITCNSTKYMYYLFTVICCFCFSLYVVLHNILSLLLVIPVTWRKERFLSVELPSLVLVIMVPASGYLADLISRKTSLSTTQIRKLYICGGLLFEIIAYIPSLLLKEDSWPYLVDNRVIDLICYSFTISGYFVNHLDIAPIFACVTMAVANLIGCIIGFYIVTGYRKPSGSRIFFSFMSAIHLFGIIFYGIWGSGDVQPWAKTSENEEEQAENSTSNTHHGIENPI